MSIAGLVRCLVYTGLMSSLVPVAARAQVSDSVAYPLAEIVVSATDPVSEATATVRVVTPAEMQAAMKEAFANHPK